MIVSTFLHYYITMTIHKKQQNIQENIRRDYFEFLSIFGFKSWLFGEKYASLSVHL